MLSVPIILAITFSVVIVAAAAFSLYWFQFRDTKKIDLDTPVPEDPEKEEIRKKTIGSVEVSRLRNTKETSLFEGDKLTIKYTGDYWPKSQEKTFSYSVNDEHPIEFLSDAKVNEATWVVPPHLYTERLQLHVESKGTILDSKEFNVVTSWKATGPKGSLVVGEVAVFTLTADGKVAKASNPILEYTLDKGESWINTNASFNPARLTFSYTPAEPQSSIMFRIRSTGLEVHKYPDELVSTVDLDYSIREIHKPPVVVTGDITSLTVQDPNGGTPGIVEPSEIVKLVWTVSNGLDLTTIDVSWSSSPDSGFVVFRSDVPAQSQTALVNIPTRETLGDTYTIYIKISSGSHSAVSASVSMAEPSWEYDTTDISVQHSDRFSSTDFTVAVKAVEIDNVKEFFNSANWNYRIAAVGDSQCKTIVSNVAYGGENFSKYGDISINKTSIADVYYVTFIASELNLPWFGECADEATDETGKEINFADIRVDLGFKPWDGEKVTKTNPKVIELSTAASQDNIDALQEWGDATIMYSSGTDKHGNHHWVNILPVPPAPTPVTFDGHFTDFTVENGATPTKLTIGYQNATNITAAVRWMLISDSFRPLVLNQGTSSPNSPTERAIEIELPTDIYDRAHIEIFLLSDPTKKIISPQFVIRPVLALNHHVGTSSDEDIITVDPGQKIDMGVYGGTYAIRSFKNVSYTTQFTEVPFTSYELDRKIQTCVSGPGVTCDEITSKTWITLEQQRRLDVSYSSVDRHGRMFVSWTPGNRTFQNPIRLRFITNGLAHKGLPEVISEATYRRFRSVELDYDSELQLLVTNDNNGTYIHEINQVVAGDQIEIAPKSGKTIATPLIYTDGSWNYNVFVAGGEYENRPATMPTSGILNVAGKMVLDSKLIHYKTSGKVYYIVLRLKSDPSVIITTDRFSYGPGFKFKTDALARHHKQDYFSVGIRVYTTADMDTSLETGFHITNDKSEWNLGKTGMKKTGNLIILSWESKDENPTSPFPYLLPWKSMQTDFDIKITVNHSQVQNPDTHISNTLTTKAIKSFTHGPDNLPKPTTLPKGMTGKVVKMPLNPKAQWVHPVYGITWSKLLTKYDYIDTPELADTTFSGSYAATYRRVQQDYNIPQPDDCNNGGNILGKICGGDPFTKCKCIKVPNRISQKGQYWINVVSDERHFGKDDRLQITTVIGDIGPHTYKNIRVLTYKLFATSDITGTTYMYDLYNNTPEKYRREAFPHFPPADIPLWWVNPVNVLREMGIASVISARNLIKI